MQRTQVTVRWNPGLHLRPASALVQIARRFRSEIKLRFGGTLTDARSILGVMLLSATLGAALDVEASGDDEREAIRAIQNFFETGPDHPDVTATPEEASV